MRYFHGSHTLRKVTVSIKRLRLYLLFSQTTILYAGIIAYVITWELGEREIIVLIKRIFLTAIKMDHHSQSSIIRLIIFRGGISFSLSDNFLIRQKARLLQSVIMQKSDIRFDNFYSTIFLCEEHPVYACRKYDKYHCKINFSRAPCLLAHFTYNMRTRYMPREKVFDIQLMPIDNSILSRLLVILYFKSPLWSGNVRSYR